MVFGAKTSFFYEKRSKTWFPLQKISMDLVKRVQFFSFFDIFINYKYYIMIVYYDS